MTEFMVPRKLITIKEASSNKYYTAMVNSKQCIYGFTTKAAAKQCALFLAEHKHKYGTWPKLEEDESKVELALVVPSKRIPESYILSNEIAFDEKDMNDLICYSLFTNMGLIAISTFSHMFKNNKIELTFAAAEIELENRDQLDSTHMYTMCISLLNKIAKL